MVTPVVPTQTDPKVKWAAIFFVLTGLMGIFKEWPQIMPFLDWLMMHGKLIASNERLQVGLTSVLGGTVFGLFWPWALPGKLTGQQAQASIRISTALVTFILAVGQDPDRTGVVTGILCMFGGPMCAMALIRRIVRSRLPIPSSLLDQPVIVSPKSAVPPETAQDILDEIPTDPRSYDRDALSSEPPPHGPPQRNPGPAGSL
jgi:hypothetical protein